MLTGFGPMQVKGHCITLVYVTLEFFLKHIHVPASSGSVFTLCRLKSEPLSDLSLLLLLLHYLQHLSSTQSPPVFRPFRGVHSAVVESRYLMVQNKTACGHSVMKSFTSFTCLFQIGIPSRFVSRRMAIILIIIKHF